MPTFSYVRLVQLLGVLSLGIAAASALGQEGHPLRGSWLGVWESNPIHAEDIVVILDWDGEQITGIINPGTDNIRIREASLDPDEWRVSIEAVAELSDGRTITYEIDGTIEDLALPNRYIVGTWRHDDGDGEFEIRRQ